MFFSTLRHEGFLAHIHMSEFIITHGPIKIIFEIERQDRLFIKHCVIHESLDSNGHILQTAEISWVFCILVHLFTFFLLELNVIVSKLVTAYLINCLTYLEMR